MKIPSVIEAVEFRREAYGLTQEQWAEVLDITQQNYTAFVHGNHKLTLAQSAKAFEYGVPADCLFQCRPDKGIRHIEKLLRV